MDTEELRQTLFIEVLLPLNLKNTFTYRVPHHLNEEVIVGKRVSVPFGRRKIMAGLIYSISDKPPVQYEARYIFDIIDNEPIVGDNQLQLWNWISHYYMSSIGLVYNAAMPAGLKLEGESKMILHPEYSEGSATLDDKETIIVESIKAGKELSISQATSLLKLNGIHKYIKSLYLKGVILLKEDINEVYKPKEVAFVFIAPNLQSDEELSTLFNTLEKRAKQQLKALMTFIQIVGMNGEIEKSELIKANVSGSAITALIAKDILVQEKRVKSRINLTEEESEIEGLQPEQAVALNKIKSAFEEPKPVLLFGVTSSGKTHIYSHLIKERLAQGKQVLYLLPEIALTTQLIQRLQIYFGSQLVVTHSKFSNNERVEVYHEISKGKPLLIVGTRSAIFQPFKNLDLIIVDEEHENSYKQHEPSPRFHARDTALYIASKNKINILLGSATPALESYYNALQNKYALVTLKKRFDNAILPQIEVVDMQLQKKQKRIRGIFSDTLLKAIEKNKANGKQTILFQNKKGYVPVLECNVCSWTPKCKNCDISLTYYKYQNNLRCHYCGFTQPVINQCAACGNKGIELIGYGTERIEDELSLHLPDLSIKRLDYNTTRLKNSHKKIIKEFADGNIDVLIGTQMVAKGLDFENVTMVGILNADHLLNFPDFRANERTFQLLTQVAGRAGRRKEEGIVYIQTSKPNHFIIERIKGNDYNAMYDTEIIERQSFHYPPFNRLIKITLKHKDALELYKLGVHCKSHLLSYFGDNLLGPEKPYVSKIRNLYILNFVVKMENTGIQIKEQKQKLRKAVSELEQDKKYNTTRIIIDVDPI
ncbi:MAG: primosomal protein N' [Bacteroidia bacterium]|nr:primosomal protein N' [Bacteroidia bacterium]